MLEISGALIILILTSFSVHLTFFVSKFVKNLSTKIIKKSNLFTIYLDFWIFKVNYARNKRSLDHFIINMFYSVNLIFFISKFVKFFSTTIIKKSNLFTIYLDIWNFKVKYAKNKRSLDNFKINMFFGWFNLFCIKVCKISFNKNNQKKQLIYYIYWYLNFSSKLG